MKKRVLTALVLISILLPVIIIEELVPIFELLIILFTIIGSIEMLNMYDKKKHMPLPVKITSIVMTLLLYSSLVCNFSGTETTLVYKLVNGIFSFHLDMYLTVGIIFLVITSCYIFVPDFETEDLGKLFVQILYISITFASFTVIRTYGIRYIFYLLLVVMSTDIFALIFGVKFGKHKMAPKISPKKSWEGAISGTVLATVLGVVFVLLYPQVESFLGVGTSTNFFDRIFQYGNLSDSDMILYVISLTILMSICGQIGDLVASKFKRTYGIKDYSNLFPGHGGVLDRFDSVLFSATIFLVLINFQTIINQLEIIEKFTG